MVPLVVVPSPQSIVAVKSLASAFGLASVNVATVAPLSAVPSVPLTVVPVAVSGASAMFALLLALAVLPPTSLTSDPEGKDFRSVDWLMRKYAIPVHPSVASLKSLRGGKSVVAAAEPMVGFGDPVFDRTSQTGTTQKVATLNRSPITFYRGMTADTVALAHALPPLPEIADELRAIGKELGAKSEDIHVGEAASVPNVKYANRVLRNARAGCRRG